jgi:ribosomal protein L23
VSTLHKDHRDILIAPVVSEKSYGLLDANKYTFLVRPDANKTEIKIAVEKVFNVKVTAVNTLNRPGKPVFPQPQGPSLGSKPKESFMNVKTFTTSVATAAIVGALGLAYAQTSSDTAAPMPPADSSMNQQPAAPATPATPTAPSEAVAPTTPAPMAEPAPQPDRG